MLAENQWGDEEVAEVKGSATREGWRTKSRVDFDLLRMANNNDIFYFNKSFCHSTAGSRQEKQMVTLCIFVCQNTIFYL